MFPSFVRQLHSGSGGRYQRCLRTEAAEVGETEMPPGNMHGSNRLTRTVREPKIEAGRGDQPTDRHRGNVFYVAARFEDINLK